MKVLQINNHHALKGGSERVYLETGRLLEERGHEVSYFSTVADSDGVDKKNMRLLPAAVMLRKGFFDQAVQALDFIYSRSVARELDKFLTSNRPDVAHLHIFYGQLTNSVISVLRRHRIPCVMSVHEYRMLCPAYALLNQEGEICHKCAGGNYLNAVAGKCIKGNSSYSALSALESFVRDRFFSYQGSIHRFVMVSKFCLDLHVRYKPELKSKSVALFNFVDLDRFQYESNKSDYFLYFGRVSREKGVATLLDAVSSTALKLKVVGNGDLLDEFKERYSDRKNIEFLGFKSGEELAGLISKARYVCVPSEWYENNPMSVIESFAYGTPVIGADIGGIPELVIDGRTGYLFKSGDAAALRDLLLMCEKLSEEEYGQLSVGAREFAEKNNAKEVHLKTLEKIYKEAIECV